MADRDALEAYCRREHAGLVRSLTLYTGDPLLAEDCAQEALLAACRRWSQVSELASPVGWLHRVGFNYAHGRRRDLSHKQGERAGLGAVLLREADRLGAAKRDGHRAPPQMSDTLQSARPAQRRLHLVDPPGAFSGGQRPVEEVLDAVPVLGKRMVFED